MNLMFWKKKPGAGNGAEEIRGDSAVNDKAQDSDSIVATQDADEGAPASSNPKTGLTARIKSAFISFTRPFRKAPIFQAGEDYADAQDDSKSAAKDAPAKNTDLKSPDSEIQAKQGLAVRIKSMLATLASRFKKTPAPAPDAEEGQDRDARRRSKNEPEQPEGASPTDLAEPSESKLIAFGSHYKKHLIFTLLFLLLACGLYAAWDTIFPPLIRSTIPPEQPRTKLEALEKKSTLLKKRSEEAQARANAMKKESEAAQAEAEALMKKEAEEKARAEAEALLRKEAEEKAQAEALMKKKAEAEALAKKKAEAEALAKKKAEERMQAAARNRSSGQQQSLDSPVRQSGGGAAPPSSPGEVAISIGQDPKVTAKSLKEAIEIMNSGSAPPPKKPAK